MHYHAIPLISRRHYKKNIVEFDYIESNVFKYIFEKTDVRVIGSIYLKETNNNLFIIQPKDQQFQYKLEHGNATHIMGYILVAPDTYVAVKKHFSWFTAICVPVICCITICCIVAFILWTCLSETPTAQNTHIVEL